MSLQTYQFNLHEMMKDELTNRSAQSLLEDELTNRSVQSIWNDERWVYKQVNSIFIILEDKLINRSTQSY
jgi:hypothetical protein